MSDKTIDVADEGNESQTSAEDTLSMMHSHHLPMRKALGQAEPWTWLKEISVIIQPG